MLTWQFLSQSETVILRRQYDFILTSQRNGKIPQDCDKFEYICQLVGPALQRQNTRMRDAIPVRKRVGASLWRLTKILTRFGDISPSLNNICNHQITRCQGIGFEFLGDMFIINSLGDRLATNNSQVFDNFSILLLHGTKWKHWIDGMFSEIL